MKPEERIVPLVRDLVWLLRRRLDARLEPLGLSQARWEPILALHRAQKPMTQTALAAALGIESPTLVRVVDRLSADGWLERRPCPNDRRAYHLILTPRAMLASSDIERELLVLRRELYGQVDPAELARCVRVMEQIRQRALELQVPGASG